MKNFKKNNEFKKKTKKLCWNCGVELESFQSDGELCMDCENFKNLNYIVYNY